MAGFTLIFEVKELPPTQDPQWQWPWRPFNSTFWAHLDQENLDAIRGGKGDWVEGGWYMCVPGFGNGNQHNGVWYYSRNSLREGLSGIVASAGEEPDEKGVGYLKLCDAPQGFPPFITSAGEGYLFTGTRSANVSWELIDRNADPAQQR